MDYTSSKAARTIKLFPVRSSGPNKNTSRRLTGEREPEPAQRLKGLWSSSEIRLRFTAYLLDDMPDHLVREVKIGRLFHQSRQHGLNLQEVALTVSEKYPLCCRLHVAWLNSVLPERKRVRGHSMEILNGYAHRRSPSENFGEQLMNLPHIRQHLRILRTGQTYQDAEMGSDMEQTPRESDLPPQSQLCQSVEDRIT
jgi:hypothetical protein